MKITKSLKERLFVMFLHRELEYRRMTSTPVQMSACVGDAKSDADYAVETIEEMNETAEIEAGGEA